MTTKTLKFGRLTLTLDRSQVFPDDPGNGTPAVVSAGRYSSTYWAATGESELLGDGDDVIGLSPAELRWLDAHASVIEEFLNGVS